MQWYEQEVRNLEALRLQQPLPPCPAVFYGSSSIRLWTSLADDLKNSSAVNLGFGGSTLEACVYFFDRLIVPARPASLTVYAGDNDLGDGRSVDQVVSYFRALLAKVEQKLPGVRMGYISVKLSPARAGLREKMIATNREIQKEIANHPAAYFIDVFEAMLSREGQPRPDLYQADGLHLSSAGYKMWTALLEPYRHLIFTQNCPPVNVGGLSSEQGESRIS